MIINKINNKNEFLIYRVAKIIIVFMFGFLFVTLPFRGLIPHTFESANLYWGFVIILLIFSLFEVVLKPSYFETLIYEKEIIIKTFSLDLRNGFVRNGLRNFILLFAYKKYLKEIKLSKQEYNGYKLIIDKSGFRRILVLQKINKYGIYETSELNISLLTQKKYTNLILSIDRLKGKVNLN